MYYNLRKLKSLTWPFRAKELAIARNLPRKIAKSLKGVFVLPFIFTLAFLLAEGVFGDTFAVEWTTKASLPTTMIFPNSVAVSGKIYAISRKADVSVSVNYEYDPNTDNWTEKSTPPLNDRYEMGSAVYNNKIYLFGGVAHGGPLANVSIYDPATDSWSMGINMPTQSCGAPASVVNDKIYVIGGYTYFGDTTGSDLVQIYDPGTDSWTAGATMPTKRIFAAAAVVNNKIYVIGGGSSTGALDTVEEYDPATDTWATKSSMPISRSTHIAAVLNDRIYVIGGSTTGVSGLDSVDVYDPATDTWTTQTSMPTGRTGFADSSDAVLNGAIYVVGGESGGYLTTVEAMTSEGQEVISSPYLSEDSIYSEMSTVDLFIEQLATGIYIDSVFKVIFSDSSLISSVTAHFEDEYGKQAGDFELDRQTDGSYSREIEFIGFMSPTVATLLSGYGSLLCTIFDFFPDIYLKNISATDTNNEQHTFSFSHKCTTISEVYKSLFSPEPHVGVMLDEQLQLDLDLHVYTSSGGHVGVNTDTGEYEISIPGAAGTGDVQGQREIIVLPAGTSFDVYVDGRQAEQDTEEYSLEAFGVNNSWSKWSEEITQTINEGQILRQDISIVQNNDGSFNVSTPGQGIEVTVLPSGDGGNGDDGGNGGDGGSSGGSCFISCF